MTPKPVLQVSRKSGFRVLAFMAIAGAGMASSAYASLSTIPAGLAPGSTYRLVFVTDDTYTATDTNIGDYNTEVSNEANSVAALAALGTTWTVIGSTSTVNAIDNIGQDAGVAIYNLDGQKVADDATTGAGGLFSGGGIINSVGYDENGDALGVVVWTGTSPNGKLANGAFPLGSGDPEWGLSYANLQGDWIQYSQDPSSSEHSLYAISGVLTAPASATPEPATTGMMVIGGVVLCLAAWRRRRSGPAVQTIR